MGLEPEASNDGVKQVGPAEITALFREAEISPRKRAHLLLHRDHADQVQRLLIACCVGTYFRPQCHPEQWELMSLLQGNADLITFNADGKPTSALPDATRAYCSDQAERAAYNHHNNASDFAF
jgi:cupin fold WbuC family metalloprotein